jgi:phosphoglycolate phosphatase
VSERFDLLVFDWDGTLMDSLATIVACLNRSARELGLEPFDEERVRQTVGLGLPDTMVALGLGKDRADWGPIVERYRDHWIATYSHQPLLFEGAAQVLERLHGSGYLMAVATGKGRRGLDADFSKTGVGRFFHASRTADETRAKPHPQMLLELLDEFGVARSRALMIGDTTYDLELAKNAGIPALAVESGSHHRSQLERCAPLACLPSVHHLDDWLAAQARAAD